jgi:DNA-binding CsgD family transcriptional regulator
MVYLNIIKSNLEDIVAPFLRQLSLNFSDLTPSEIQVAGLVKDGKTTKEIADLLNSSTGAVNFHRNNIRKKLGLRNIVSLFTCCVFCNIVKFNRPINPSGKQKVQALFCYNLG